MGTSLQKTMQSSLTAYLSTIVYINSLLQITLSVVPSQIPQMVTRFTISDRNSLQHVAVHQTTGDVYVGAHNIIYKLDRDLNIQSQQNWLTAGIETTTNPSENNNCDSYENDEINDNKILMIDYDNELLLSCGSSHCGTCVLHSLDSVSYIEGRLMSNLANDSIAVGETVVAYFGQFRTDTMTSSVVYVGSTYEDNPPSSSIIQHAVATKRLSRSESGQWQMKLAYEDPLLGRFTYIDLRNEDVKRNFKIKYVYGFSIAGDPGFSYFLTVQKDDVGQNDYKSKIVRICQEDKGYYSYTEMTIKCKSSTNENFRILQAAYVGKAGNHLYNSMSGVEAGDDILYTVFSQSANVNSREPVERSALCIFPLPKIQKQIRLGLQLCFNGIGTRGLEHIERSESTSDCWDLYYRVLNDRFCGTSQLHPIDTGKSLSVVDSLRDGGAGAIFTSIAVKPIGDDTVAVIGTKSGHLLKFLVQPIEQDTPYAGIPFKNLLLDGPVLQDMTFDPSQEHVYAMTPETIYKFALSTCDHYMECSACILTHDPTQCGWCGSGCAMRDECVEEGGTWVTDFCPPVIYQVSPLSAPLNSPVEVTLIGDNLGTNLGYGIHEFMVAGKPCVVQQAASDAKRIVCTVEPVSYQLTGPVIAHVEADSIDPVYRVNGNHSNFKFSFLEPSIDNFRPAYGYVDGGTILTISGRGLNSGNSQVVTVGGFPCSIQSSNDTTLICTTTGSMVVNNGIVELEVDGKTFATKQKFSYMLPPIITSFSPNSSYASGGRLLVVNGKYLHVVENPKIVITLQKKGENFSIEATCKRAELPGFALVCPSPNIAEQGIRVSAGAPIIGSVSFLFEEWYDTPREIDGQGIVYYSDPYFNKFTDVLQVSKGLIIEGSNLDLASNASEIIVMVRDEICVVTKLTRTMLECRVPSLKNYTTAENDRGHLVTVTVGNVQAEIGRIQYLSNSSSGTVVAVVVIVILAIVAFAIIMIWFKHSKRKTAGLLVEGATVLDSVTYARSISQVGSQQSGSQYSGEGRVVPLSQVRNNTYLRNPSAESSVEETAPLLQQISNELAVQVSEVLINESNLQLGETIGQGQFGCVYMGKYIQDGEELHVAVKSLLRGAREDIADFLREGIMMKDFKHENVLRLIGVCIKEDKIPLVVLPYMKHGDLLAFIRNGQNELTARQLLQFSRHIASGMAYLSSLMFVHRDLAARNCMLDAEFCVKVADFGLSRDIYERSYYSAKDKTAKLPVRWMALECLERNIYNTKTDVWSFGVVMWELMTRGITPYPSVDNCDLAAFLQHGGRLPQPNHCPDNVFDVMNICWLASPMDRPTFNQVVAQLDEILTSKDNPEETDKEDMYINVPSYAT